MRSTFRADVVSDSAEVHLSIQVLPSALKPAALSISAQRVRDDEQRGINAAAQLLASQLEQVNELGGSKRYLARLMMTKFQFETGQAIARIDKMSHHEVLEQLGVLERELEALLDNEDEQG